MSEQLNSINNLKYVYFIGDLFWAKEDKNDVVNLLNKAFESGYVIGNCEGSLELTNIENSKKTKKAIRLSLNESICKVTENENIYFSFVNNHSSDNGKEAFKQLIKLFGKQAVCSLTIDDDPRKKVGDINLIFFADPREECRCAEYNFLRFDRSNIIKYSEFINHSYVIVHGGIEYREYPTLYQRNLAKLLVNFGAEAVIFHHSHTIGKYEWFNGKLIHYGLGNFYFSQINSLHGLDNIRGVVLRLDLEKRTFCCAKINFFKRENEIHTIFKFDEMKSSSNNFPEGDYRSWYKNKYRLDPSMRPRQLYNNENIINLQYMIWYSIASKLVNVGLSGSIKRVIRKLLKPMLCIMR